MTEPKASLSDAVQKLTDSFAKIGHVLTAQGAMGWMFQGELEKAKGALQHLPVDQLRALSVAASMLASLADEVAATKG